ncbi:MAG: hypothetical protein R3246_13610, partial [Acidimicrobiia bacterium]|nr:hypothetical protein [Acidimicrobiia bacterium]
MTPNSTPVRRLRRGSLSVALWLFGLSTTVLLVGIWGRAVASDEEAIVGGTRAVLESEAVAGRITNWIGDGMAAAADGLPAAVRGDAADAVWDRPEMQAVIGDVVRRFVDAALAP